jgi:hypothetical protein
MNTYTKGPEEALNDLVMDLVVAGHLARDRRLTPDHADRLVVRVKAAAGNMVERDDAALLTKTANLLERASVRIKSAEVRPRTRSRAKAAPAPRPQPDIPAMIRQANAEQINRGGPFDRDTSEDLERQRAAEQNRQLAAKNEQAERARREQIEAEKVWQSQDEGVAEVPWWRRG